MLDAKEILFPHDDVRPAQEDLVKDVIEAINRRGHLIAHAPTGLGKTAATLAPAISYALKNKLHVLFLTSRHTQHTIAMETIRKIKEKHGKEVIATSVIGKKWMCLHPGVERLSSSEFSEYCKLQREDNRCEFYSNTKKDDHQKTLKADQILSHMIKITPIGTEKTKKICEQEKLCPYEMAMLLASEAQAIVTDYYYVFNPVVSDQFMNKAGITLDKCVLIVDEGHNLPGRIRELLTAQMSDVGIEFALKEAEKYNIDDEHLFELKNALERLGENLREGNEMILTKDKFMEAVRGFTDYDAFIKECRIAEDTILEKQKRSSIAKVGEFLEKWKGQDKGFARILSRKKTNRGPTLQLSYRCLDPSLITEDIIKKSHSTILMSGTLTPTAMYKDLMRFPVNTKMMEYPSPFDKENRLTIIVPKTTTKYSERSEQQFQNIAKQCVSIVDNVPGNSAIFFPSYRILNDVKRYLETATTKTVFTENPGLSKQEREQILAGFKNYKDTGAILLAVSSGSFGEGVDLPGDLLKGVVVVGIPLGIPDLETKELIKYYDHRYRKGWDYGYTLPAITKVMQNAGRCIRTETDRGIIAFVDERYSWPRYLGCFPRSWNLKIKVDCAPAVREFFDE